MPTPRTAPPIAHTISTTRPTPSAASRSAAVSNPSDGFDTAADREAADGVGLVVEIVCAIGGAVRGVGIAQRPAGNGCLPIAQSGHQQQRGQGPKATSNRLDVVAGHG